MRDKGEAKERNGEAKERQRRGKGEAKERKECEGMVKAAEER
jgi:hypothetical protein